MLFRSSFPSDLLHGDVGAINHYVRFDGTRGTPDVSPSGTFSVETLTSSVGMLIHILRIVNEKFNLVKGDQIDILDQELTRHFTREGTSSPEPK